MKLKFSFICLFVFLPIVAFAKDWRSTFTAELKNGGAIAVDQNGKVLFEHRAGDPFIPASTIKVATAAAALKILGEDFRFQTDFYTDADHKLYVKGYGDPSLVSEEWQVIAAELKAHGLKNVTTVVVDDSAFDPAINIDGASASTNPYDAVNGALIANFNTINVSKTKTGAVVSAEPQTPITPLVRDLAKKLGAGTQRVNLGKTAHIGARYAGEILVEFLRRENVVVTGGVVVGNTLPSAQILLEHKSTKTLADNLRGMLEFSTNFISNQLFLFLGRYELGGQATVSKGLQTIQNFLAYDVGWNHFTLAEGAGLSRQNQVTPREMIQLLSYFEPHRDLLALKEGVLRAKSGTLTGVNSLIGYFDSRTHGRVKFVILVNSPVAFDYKFKLGKFLYENLQ